MSLTLGGIFSVHSSKNTLWSPSSNELRRSFYKSHIFCGLSHSNNWVMICTWLLQTVTINTDTSIWNLLWGCNIYMLITFCSQIVFSTHFPITPPQKIKVYLNDTCLWVIESIPSRLWGEFAFPFALLLKTVKSLFKFFKFKVLQTKEKNTNKHTWHTTSIRAECNYAFSHLCIVVETLYIKVVHFDYFTSINAHCDLHMAIYRKNVLPP